MYVGFGVLLITGLTWLLLDKFVVVAGEFGPEHHPAEHITLIVRRRELVHRVPAPDIRPIKRGGRDKYLVGPFHHRIVHRDIG